MIIIPFSYGLIHVVVVVVKAVAEFQGQYYSPSDLKTFFSKYVDNSKNDTVAHVYGTNNAQDPVQFLFIIII
jgi:hypothetical protein